MYIFECFSFLRYEDEINKRTDCENNFVLIKKVCLSLHIHILKMKQLLACQLCQEPTFSLFHLNINHSCIY